MEIYGNPCPRLPPIIQANLWKPIEIHGDPWKSMETNGNLWQSIEIKTSHQSPSKYRAERPLRGNPEEIQRKSEGNPWKSMEIHGNPWKSMEIHGNPWKFMEIHGNHGDS